MRKRSKNQNVDIDPENSFPDGEPRDEGPESQVEPSADDAGEETTGGSGLEAELEELKDRHLRLAAEFENFRKRTRREAESGRAMAQADLARRILPTLDDLARVADTPHESTTVEALDKGIELILKNFRKQLEDAGMASIDAVDQRFDPERHEAVTTVPTDDPELDETVAQVFVEGFEFGGRLVRPAQVAVRRYEEEATSGKVETAVGEGDS